MSLRLLAATTLAALGAWVAVAAPPAAPKTARAVFAGGCFWCMEGPFEALPGVLTVSSGYAGGQEPHPTYEQVSSGRTGHAESVQVVYDPSKVTYEQLLETYWHNVDPTQANGQFCDRGRQYRTAIFAADEAQRRAAEESKRRLEASGKLPGRIVTEIVPGGPFYPAEEYHQDYARKNPLRYRFYRSRCGRDARLERLWGGAPVH